MCGVWSTFLGHSLGLLALHLIQKQGVSINRAVQTSQDKIALIVSRVNLYVMEVDEGH
jgi:hypothetical protein